MRFLILFLILVIPQVSNSDSSQIRKNYLGDSFKYNSNGVRQKPIHKPKPELPIHKPGHKPGHKPDHGWHGPPYYLPPYNVYRPSYGYNGQSRDPETVIIREREIIREVPVIIQQPVPEKVWVPPVYETKIIKGHYIGGIKETIEDGYRTFSDDPEQNIWVPEKEIQVVKTPGYYK